jgi:hypothetical protein
MDEMDVFDALLFALSEEGRKRHAGKHVWRNCKKGEPIEEGGVCIKCGAWATSEEKLPCNDKQ